MDGPSGSRTEKFTTYKWRWYVLGVVSLLNISNAAVWISFASVANYAAIFYERSTDDVNYFSLVYFIATIPMGLVAMVIIDKRGLRLGVLIGAFLNVLGAIIRAISTAKFVPVHDMFWISMLGQTFAGVAQAFVLIIPTKVAELWFPDNQRAIATSVVSMANPIGIIVGMVLSPLIVHEPNDMRLLNIIIAIPCILSAVLAFVGIRSSTPPTPPSYSSTVVVNHSYISNIKLLGGNMAYIILAFSLGAGLGGISALMTVLQPFLCSRGYSDTFTGICGALLIFCGLVGAGITGTIVDKTKLFTETTKVCFAFTAFSSIFYSMIVQEHNQSAAVAISCCLLGLFGFGAYPVGLELGVECSYPVPEATSSGIIIVIGQLLGIVIVQVVTVIRQEMSAYNLQFATCTVSQHSSSNSTTASPLQVIKAYDMTVPGIAFAAFLSFITIVLLAFFKTDYHRMKAEEINRAQAVMSGTVNNTNRNRNNSVTESGSYQPIFS